MKISLITIITAALAVTLSGVSAEEKADAKGKGQGGGEAASNPKAAIIFAAIDANPDLRLLGRPDMNLLSFASDTVSVFHIADEMKDG